MNRYCLLVTLLGLAACSAAETKPVPDETASFETEDKAPLVEPEAGPAPVVTTPDAGQETLEANDGGVPVEDAAVAPLETAAAPDAGKPDAGQLKPEPILATPELNERFQKALELAPDDPAAAVVAFDSIFAEAPDFYFAAYNSALSLQRTGQLDAAETRLRELHGQFGDRYHGFAEALAWILHGRGASTKAEAMLKEAVDAHPLVLSIRNSYGRLLIELERHDEAGDFALGTLKKDEVNVGAMQVLGWSFCKRKKMDLCLLVLGNALKVPGKEKDGMTNYLMALAYLQFAERASKLRAEASVRVANNHLKMAAQAMPDRVEVLVNYARVLLDTGDTEQAEKLSKRATQLAPNDVAAWLVYGVALRDNKKRDESRKAQLKALAVAPQQHEALFNLAILYLDHPLKKVDGDEICPDVSLDQVKDEFGDDLFEGIAIAREDPAFVDSIRRVRQAGIYLNQYKEAAQPKGELSDRVEGLLREVDKWAKKIAKKRMRIIKRDKRNKKKAERRRKKLERERKKKEAEAKKKAEEEAAAAAKAAEENKDQPEAQPETDGQPTSEKPPATTNEPTLNEQPAADQPPATEAAASTEAKTEPTTDSKETAPGDTTSPEGKKEKKSEDKEEDKPAEKESSPAPPAPANPNPPAEEPVPSAPETAADESEDDEK